MTTNGQYAKPRVAILIEQKVEDVEFQMPYTALKQAGAEVVVLGSRVNEAYKGKQGDLSIKADATPTESRASDFAAVIIPGGMAPDKMRTNMKTVRFVQDAIAQNILVASVCHGPQVLIEGDLLKGKKATGVRAIRKDMQNAGANYVDAPIAIDGNLITSRRPGDLPIFTTAILQHLGLSVPDTTLPDIHNLDAGWWKLAEQWGGSSKSEIVAGINTAIAGERYGAEAFERYADQIENDEARNVLRGIRTNKLRHIQMLEQRLAVLGESESLPAAASGAYATLKSWLQTNNSDIEILRRALGDLQTGIVDTDNLVVKFTDPATTEIFSEMEVTIAQDEQHVADIYHRLIASGAVASPNPTSNPAVSA